MKKWEIKSNIQLPSFGGKSTSNFQTEDLISILLKNRGLETKVQQQVFLSPPNPYDLTAADVAIDPRQLKRAVSRITKAIETDESIIVYADYDADGITAGTVLWETLHAVGARVMPYIPHRFDEGYGLSIIGINKVKEEHNATLIITVDQGITAWEKVEYAKSLGIDVIVTDHHTKPERLPDCTIVHTTNLSGSGVSWFLSKTLLETLPEKRPVNRDDLVGIASIGTIADMVPLVGPNRSVTKFGLESLKKTKRPGILALFSNAGTVQENLTTYDVSHMVAPRLNAMGRLEHAMDALRLLCTTSTERATELAQKLGETNKERQFLTQETAMMTKDLVYKSDSHKQQKILVIAHAEFNQGIIGLAAGKLVEEFYLPAIVIAKGELISKASARSIAGFNITEVLRMCQELLIDVGGHPMAAGFTVETKNLGALQEKLEKIAREMITPDMLIRHLSIDCELPLSAITHEVWEALRDFEPFGFGNPEPTFISTKVKPWDVRKIGAEGKHLKLRISQPGSQMVEAVAFSMGDRFEEISQAKEIDIAYGIDKNEWNGKTTLQVKIKDIHSTIVIPAKAGIHDWN